MSTLTKTVNNAIVYYDSTYTHRWYDAYGPGVVKFLTEWDVMPIDNTSHDPVRWYCNMTEAGGASAVALADAAGGVVQLTTAGNENDGVQMQLAGGAGENVLFDGDYQTYFGIKFAVDDATQSDVLVGLCVTDTDCLGGVTDGLYFRKVDGSTTLYAVMENTNSEDASVVATMANNTGVIAEFLYNGVDCRAYINGVLATIFDKADTDWPDDEELRLTIEFLAGAGAAKTMSIWWTRLIHLRG